MGHNFAGRVAMIGGGQLARMTQQAAVDLDVQLTVLAAGPDEPAVLAGAPWLSGRHTDLEALTSAAGAAPVLTFDHELVPPELLARLEAGGCVLRPSAKALSYAQDKLAARRRFRELGLPVPAFAPIHAPADVDAFGAEFGWPVVLKARSGGYDGRGVLVVDGAGAIPSDLEWGDPDDPTWLAEEHVELEAELAVVVARRPSGSRVTYPPVRTTQEDGICRWLVSPVPGLGGEAADLAEAVADAVDAVGICAVELFVRPGGALLVNEIALRPHNSGHASIEANVTSQFHQHLRAVLDWPLGATDLVAPAAAMVNVITPSAGVDLAANLPHALAVPDAHVHLYAKSSRPGRKVGHVTVLGADVEQALASAAEAAARLLKE